MSDLFSRRNFLALMGLTGAATIDSIALTRGMTSAVLHEAERMPHSPVVVRGNARFQILSPTVIRMEYAPSGYFIDALSVAVMNRSWPICPYTVHEKNGWVEIATNEMWVRYKLDSGKFAADNLAVSWTDVDGAHAWKPGDVDDKNLGGVPGSEGL